MIAEYSSYKVSQCVADEIAEIKQTQPCVRKVKIFLNLRLDHVVSCQSCVSGNHA
jgi:hypothetical protein